MPFKERQPNGTSWCWNKEGVYGLSAGDPFDLIEETPEIARRLSAIEQEIWEEDDPDPGDEEPGEASNDLVVVPFAKKAA